VDRTKWTIFRNSQDQPACKAYSGYRSTSLRRDSPPHCDPKGRRALLRTPSTEGRSVCLCWAPSKPKGPKGPLGHCRTLPIVLPWGPRRGGVIISEVTLKVDHCQIFAGASGLQGVAHPGYPLRPTREPCSLKIPPPLDPTLGLCLGPRAGPGEVGVSYGRGTLVL